MIGSHLYNSLANRVAVVVANQRQYLRHAGEKGRALRHVELTAGAYGDPRPRTGEPHEPFGAFVRVPNDGGFVQRKLPLVGQRVVLGFGAPYHVGHDREGERRVPAPLRYEFVKGRPIANRLAGSPCGKGAIVDTEGLADGCGERDLFGAPKAYEGVPARPCLTSGSNWPNRPTVKVYHLSPRRVSIHTPWWNATSTCRPPNLLWNISAMFS